MSKRKIIIPIEDQITDFFTDAPQGAAETLLRVCQRIVGKRFPLVVEVKGNGKAQKVAKPVKSALGASQKTPRPVMLEFEGEQHELKPIESAEAK